MRLKFSHLSTAFQRKVKDIAYQDCAALHWKDPNFFKPNDQHPSENLPDWCLPGQILFRNTGQKLCLSKTGEQGKGSMIVCNKRAETYRLPKHLVPLKYRIKVYVFMGKKSSKGEIEIDFKCTDPTNHIVLHANNSAFDINKKDSVVMDQSNQGKLARTHLPL